MERLSRYFSFLIVVLLLVCLLYLLYTNSRLTEAIDRLDSAKAKVDSSLNALALTRGTIDSVQHELGTFGSYVHDIQARVEILDLNTRSGSDRFSGQQAAISDRLKTLYREVDATGRNLPEIPIVHGSSTKPLAGRRN